MFHIGGSFICNTMLCHGASVAFGGDFDTDTFWETAKSTRSTVVFLLGVMATFLSKRAAAPHHRDRDHELRLVFMVPLPDDVHSFSERFGVDVYTIFNMTEVATPVFSEPNPTQLGTCGRARDGVEVRLVDENDCEVAPGEVGEMMVRMDRPWAMNHGYYKNPEATVKAWRNGWFHTGDAFRRDAEGNLYFVDRMKDAIRRRGENISSFEVESEVAANPAVREAAAIPVPSELGEDEVMVVIARWRSSESIRKLCLISWCREWPTSCCPATYGSSTSSPRPLPRRCRSTSCERTGSPPDTWDCEAVGIRVTREGVRRGRRG